MIDTGELMNTIIKRCTRCVLPEHFPNIRFDHVGICNVCSDYDHKWSCWKKSGLLRTTHELEKIFNNVKKLNTKYDCLVPFSGGKDSAYVLYICKHIFKLNVLAFNFNNGFQTEEAISNIYRIVKLLNVDLVMLTPKWSLMKELYRLFLLKAGEACTPCNVGIELGSYRIAKQEHIPLIVYGNSPRTEECSPKEIFVCNREYFMNVIHKHKMQNIISGTLYDDINSNASLIHQRKSKTSHKIFIKTKSLIIASLLNTPMRINVPEYIKWNENEIFDVLENKLKWEGTKFGKEHMDCEISPIKSYLRYLRWGFGSKTQKCAALVRDGQLDRNIALELIKEEKNEPRENFETLFKKLELTSSHLDEIKKSYHLDYL